MGTITELWRYPVKSMQGEQVDRAEVHDRGLAGDRGWALVDGRDGRVASAKHPRKWGVLLQCAARLVDGDTVEITGPDGTVVRSDDPEVDAALSAIVGREARLVRTAPTGAQYEMVVPDVEGAMPEDVLAAAKIADGPDGMVTAMSVSLAAPPGALFDVSALHLIGAATVAGLGGDVRRFRPNVVVDDGAAYGETTWVDSTLSIGASLRASVLMPTMRCVMTTLPQPGLARDRGILQTIVRDNRIEISGLGIWACAGVYATVAVPGPIAVRDTVEVS